MKHRFFLDHNGRITDKVRKLLALSDSVGQEVIAFRDSIGAARVAPSGDSYVFTFDQKPDSRLWTSDRGGCYYRPRKNTTEGKELRAKVNALPRYPNLADAIGLIPGLSGSSMGVLEGNTMYRTFIRYYNLDLGVVIVSVPWPEVDEQKLADYKAQVEGPSEERTHWNHTLDHMLWTPPEWLREIKEWEALRLIEDLVIP